MSCQMAEGSELRAQNLEVKIQAIFFLTSRQLIVRFLLEIITVSMKWEERLAVENCQSKKQKLRKKEAKNCPAN